MNKLIRFLPLFLRKKLYKDSGIRDMNGKPILEGSIIMVKYLYSYFGGLPFNGVSVHCVEFHDGQFGSDVHSDFEPLNNYDIVIVLGHVEEYRKDWHSGEWYIIEGNFGSCIK